MQLSEDAVFESWSDIEDAMSDRALYIFLHVSETSTVYINNNFWSLARNLSWIARGVVHLVKT